MPSDLDLTDADLAAAWEAARGQERGWCLCSYAEQSNTRIVCVASGSGGYDELRAVLGSREDGVSYATLPATVDGRLRFVFLCYIGERTSALRRGRVSMHAPHVEKLSLIHI